MRPLPEYIFSQLAKMVAETESSSGRKVLNFGPGNPDVPPSPIYINKLAEFIHGPKAHFYPGYKGIDEFNTALLSWYWTRFKVKLEPDEILPLLGAKDAVSHLPLALTGPGDEILVPDPGYPAYIGPAILAGVNPIPYSSDFSQKITSRTRAVWLNFPNNPTGQVASLADLDQVITLARKRGLKLLYDNAYSEITFDGYVAPSILQIKHAKKVAVEIGSFSKTFSFAGFRMGWIVGNKNIISALAKVKSQIDSGLSLPLQQLGAFALTNFDRRWQKKALASYRLRRDIIAAKLRRLGLTFTLPQGALYIWAKIPDSQTDSSAYCLRLLREKQVLFTPGSAFGSAGHRYVRVSFCVNIDQINDYL